MPATGSVLTSKRAAELGVWFGLVAGIGEVTLLGARRLVLGHLVGAAADIVWMVPLTLGLAFGALAVIVTLIARVAPPVAERYLAGGLAALGMASLLFQYGPLARTAAVVLAAGVGALAARVWGRFAVAAGALVRRTTIPLCALVALLAGALAGARWYRDRPGPAAPPPGSPNVLLLILDTVRAIDLSGYGFSRPTTPALDQFAGQGIRFAHALATAPWTLPSHASMFTGRWPNELSADWTRPLDETDPTLAERLGQAGYRTAGFVANTRYCSRETGLARGFQHYEDYPITAAQALLAPRLGRVWFNRIRQEHWLRLSADEMNGRLLRWIEHEPRGRPFFAFVNYLDAHDPYDPPAPFAGRYSGRTGVKWERPETSAMDWPDSLVRLAHDTYDESLAYLDARIGGLLRQLDSEGLLRNTIVVITADHGEEFGEHGVFYHGNSLYRRSLEVPLLIAWPGHLSAGRVIDQTVSLRDLPSTILDLAGVNGTIPGSSLARFWAGEPPARDTLYASVRTHRGLPPRTPVSRGDLSSALIGDLRLIRNGDGRIEAYDFASDPEERRDLMRSDSTRSAAAKAAAVLWPDLAKLTR